MRVINPAGSGRAGAGPYRNGDGFLTSHDASYSIPMRGQHGSDVMTTITMMELTKILLVFASMASLVHAKVYIPRPFCEDCTTDGSTGTTYSWTSTGTSPWPGIWDDDSSTASYPSLVADGDTYAECALVQELVEKDQAGE